MTVACHCGRPIWIPQSALLYPSMSDILLFRSWVCRHGMPIPYFWDWRQTIKMRPRPHRLRAQWTRLMRVRLFPSPIQREFNRGDPNGVVERLADQIIAQMSDEEWKQWLE